MPAPINKAGFLPPNIGNAEDKLRQAYQSANLTLRQKEVKIGYLVALILVPAGFILDYIYYPQFYWGLVSIRAACVIVLFILYALSDRFTSHKAVWLTGIFWPLIINAAICGMIFISEGVASPYYAGINLAIIGAALILPITLKESAIIVFVSLAMYILTVLAYSNFTYPSLGAPLDFQFLFNNVYFILLTGLIASVASFYNERQRYKEFSLQFELDQRNKQLAALNRSKSEFFANISHELRTPLTLIISPIQDLLESDQPFDFKVNRMLTTAKDNAYRLLKLVNDLLSVIRLDESKAKLTLGPIKLIELLRSTASNMQYLAEKQHITLSINLPLTEPQIAGNANAMEKIFTNLIGNAIKFTPAGGTIGIFTENKDDRLRIIFKDDGIGIEKADLPYIFDRFTQADSSTTRKYQGTGLGLALVKELTQAQSGRVFINSEVGAGTVISLYFPILSDLAFSGLKSNAATPDKQTDADGALEKIHQLADYTLHLNLPETEVIAPHQIKQEAANITKDETEDSRPSLLIVDDEPDLRRYMVNTFSHDYQILSASDGKLGLELAIKHQPDLLLLDLMLPKMDGLEVCRRIKQNDALKFTKILLLTARIDEQSKLQALENGADDFLTKPFSTVEIKTRLKNLWAAAQLEIGLQAQNAQLVQAFDELKQIEAKLLHSEKLSAIGSLAAGLLHEVNNPLNYAITAVQMLRRDPSIKEDEDLAEIVNDIYEGMDRIRIIVRDLHTFAYPSEADKEQKFSLNDAVSSALRFTAAEKRGVDIDINIDDNIVAMGSNSHIVQVLINLMSNAFKAMKSVDAPSLVISAEEKSVKIDGDIQPRIVLKIRDNGTGMSDETAKRIFEPFYTTRDVGEGLGMGLSICHTIIKNHGGEIEVESEPGKYTEFKFDLKKAS